jgi:hypothetical protein
MYRFFRVSGGGGTSGFNPSQQQQQQGPQRQGEYAAASDVIRYASSG